MSDAHSVAVITGFLGVASERNELLLSFTFRSSHLAHGLADKSAEEAEPKNTTDRLTKEKSNEGDKTNLNHIMAK